MYQDYNGRAEINSNRNQEQHSVRAKKIGLIKKYDSDYSYKQVQVIWYRYFTGSVILCQKVCYEYLGELVQRILYTSSFRPLFLYYGDPIEYSLERSNN